MGRVIKAGTVGNSDSQGTDPSNGPANPLNLSSSVKTAIIETAAAMAERILEAEIDRDPALMERLLVRSLLFARNFQNAKVSVHPLDRAAFDIDALVAKKGFAVESDEAMGRGGCRIIADVGEVDAAVSTLISVLSASLKEAL